VVKLNYNVIYPILLTGVIFMSNIIGINLINISVKKGQEHDMISAEVFMDEKVIGNLINDGWGEEYYIEFIDRASENEFKKRMKRYYKRKKILSPNYDIFIKELLFINKEYRTVKNTHLKCEQLTFLWG
jgi:hypothetical protein